MLNCKQQGETSEDDERFKKLGVDRGFSAGNQFLQNTINLELQVKLRKAWRGIRYKTEHYDLSFFL